MIPVSIQDFAGQNWQISREIRDHLTGQINHFAGQASFTAQGAHWRYREVGQLTLPSGQVLNSERSYHWRPMAGKIAVDFDDGRPFHHIKLGKARPSAEHLCDPDYYKVAYDFAQWPEWRADWQVHGPRKHYKMISEYCPRVS